MPHISDNYQSKVSKLKHYTLVTAPCQAIEREHGAFSDVFAFQLAMMVKLIMCAGQDNGCQLLIPISSTRWCAATHPLWRLRGRLRRRRERALLRGAGPLPPAPAPPLSWPLAPLQLQERAGPALSCCRCSAPPQLPPGVGMQWRAHLRHTSTEMTRKSQRCKDSMHDSRCYTAILNNK